MKKKHYFFIAAAILIILFLLALFLTPKPSLSGEVVSVVTPDYVELRWNNDNIVSQKVGTATTCESTINSAGEKITECDWTWQELDASAESWRDYDSESKLKFYQIKSKVQVGSGSCAPICSSGCGMQQVLTWVDPCTGECLTPCAQDQLSDSAYCCFIDSDSQGWYDAPCSTAEKDPSSHLVAYDGSCHTASQICDKDSAVLVKFTQDLVSGPRACVTCTSINWLTATQDVVIDPENPLKSASRLLQTNIVDYVSTWNPTTQQYYGAAFGIEPSGMQVITGPFELKQYHPYFVGAKQEAKITWAGPLPDWQTFDLKYVTKYMNEPKDAENFIVLPFDTSIKMASDLCDESVSGIPIEQQQGINEWDPIMQQEIISGGLGGSCEDIRLEPAYDFALEPGKVYKIIVDADADWEQK